MSGGGGFGRGPSGDWLGRDALTDTPLERPPVGVGELFSHRDRRLGVLESHLFP